MEYRINIVPTPMSIRVFSLRPDQREFGPEPGESVVRVDRDNPALGNPHLLHNQNDPAERERVIAAYVADSEADWAAHGPRRHAIEDLARRVAGGESIALACWCKPRACHGDWIAKRVLDLVQRGEFSRRDVVAPASAGRAGTLRNLLALEGLSWQQIKVCMGGDEADTRTALDALIRSGEVTYRNCGGRRTFYLSC